MTDNINPIQLQSAVSAAGAQWQANETTISQLSTLEKRMRLGYVPSDGELTLEQREQSARMNFAVMQSAIDKGQTFSYPSYHNLQDGGYVTPIKDQSSCGSCVAFGAVATVEATYQMQKNKPNSGIDLSEAQLFYCYASLDGYGCGTGWWVSPALEAFVTGISDEACFPYIPGDQACVVCADWQNQAIKIKSHHEITDLAEMKEWLSTKGALVACFTVYSDFYYYSNGIYRYVSGDYEGGHCVSIVGYDDVASCWICKNSWGEGWGENGFFRIGYGECGIDATMWAVDSVVEPLAMIAPVYEYNATAPWRYQYSTSPDVQDGWTRLGIGFYAFGASQPGTVPVYQCRAENPWRYFYSTQGCIGEGWTNDGIAFYAYETQVENTIPVYRYVAAEPWRYQYSTSPSIGDRWTNEGIAFYVYAAKPA
ncbi:MAG: C1 family peptidase [Drouetiella hepatica Uher 2000/2452]|jgi:C1A family cysteine protease|uniref:C1 family peptidase n=1 Tax=Drouetiella hepatica Uher 2000/2452 TaxID=904376 RepID=A0A951QAR5_9CYAN|nr:C1 family peptidase [Drouetiella hepatica Uher 2000/2452]